MPAAARHALTLAMAAGATVLAFICRHVVDEPSLALVYVVPVAVAAGMFGWSEAATAAIAGALAFDFFFVRPLYSLWITNPADLWALLLLLVVGAIMSVVAGQARRRAREARQAAGCADALQRLAHAVIYASGAEAVVRLAAEALSRIFGAPTVVLLESGGGLEAAALTQGATLSDPDLEAARAALEADVATRAQTYPATEAVFDFWPIASPGHARFVLGVNFSACEDGRPDAPFALIEPVAGYVAMALAEPLPDRRSEARSA